MINTIKYATDNQRDIPVGFTLESFGRDTFNIRFKRTGMGCMNIFIVAWLLIWTAGCVLMLHQYFTGGHLEDGDPIPIWFIILFLIAEIGGICLFLFLLFSKKTFSASYENLVVETDVLGLKRIRTIPRHTIHSFVQVKDGGEGDDSFPSWGLKLHGEKKITLISRQPHEKSRWLGQVLAQWAGVEFKGVSKD